jgi:hypothetical protein
MASLRAEHASVLDAVIPAAADIERMGAVRTVLAEFAPHGRAAAAYEALWAEIRVAAGGPSRDLADGD